eukprot:6355287-Pyramimonas_sp.AAC.1
MPNEGGPLVHIAAGVRADAPARIRRAAAAVPPGYIEVVQTAINAEFEICFSYPQLAAQWL